MALWRIAMWACGILVLVLFVAWIDGGEEPLRTIDQPLELARPVASGDAR